MTKSQHPDPDILVAVASSSIPTSLEPKAILPGEELLPAIPAIPVTVQHSQPQDIVYGLILRHPAVQRVVKILINGRESIGKNHSFVAHFPLTQLMSVDYNKREAEPFLTHLEEYLTRIPHFTPQCGHTEQAPALVSAIRALMMEYGFVPVASKILSVLYNPA